MFLSFSKYHGAGNDFILIDDRSGSFPCDNFHLISRLCDRRLGIGADGLLLLQTSNFADFRIRIFNSDGKEAGMCGNGMRCFIHYLRSLGFRDEQFQIETMHDTISCSIKGERISVKIEKPKVLHWGIEIQHNEDKYEAYVLNTGVPHAVIFVEDLDHVEVETLGRSIRNHEAFSPLGVNVNFAKLGADGSLRVRTYERGVEAETPSCGTGAAAVALTALQKWDMPSPVRIVPRSLDCLEVHVNQNSIGGKDLELIGTASYVFDGRIAIDNLLD